MPPEVNNPEPGAPANPPAGPAATTPPANPETPAGPAETRNASPSPANPATPALPTQMPDLDNEAAWEGFPKWIRELRQENARRRTENTTLTQKVTDLEREKMSEADRLKADFEAATKTTIPDLQKQVRTLTVQLTAQGMGIVDPEAATTFLDWTAIDQGTSVEDALNQLVEKRPWLKGAVTTTPAASTSSPANPACPAVAKPRWAPATRRSSADPIGSSRSPRVPTWMAVASCGSNVTANPGAAVPSR